LHVLLVAAWGLFAAACVLGELDLSGKNCPCSGAYTCELATNKCVRNNASAGDGGNTQNDGTIDPLDGAPPGDANETFEDVDTFPDATDDSDGGDAGPRDADDPADGGDAEPGDATIPETCTLDGECGATHICENMTCVPRCGVVNGTVCVDPDVCNPNTGRCVPGHFELGVDCGFNAQCESGYCLNVTTSTTAGTQRFCSVPCSSTTDCPSEQSCLDLGGMSFCLRETAFAPPATFDTPPGGMCTESSNTCQSRTCNIDTSQCIQRCTRESDCVGYGGNCWTWADGGYANICFTPGGAAAGTACGADNQCISGVCNRYTGTCAEHCCTEADCDANETCGIYDITPTEPVRVCRPRAGMGTGMLGDSCQNNSDCESELCAPQNPNGMGPRRCSVHCCEPTDCGALPSGGLCWPLPGALPNTIVGTCLPR
jgi:hypothetical protein